MNKNLIILSVIAGVVIFVLGGGLGVFYQTQKGLLQTEKVQTKVQTMETVIKSLSSKVIPSIIAYGEVTNIEGRNITLSYGGESLTIKIKDDSQIFSFVKTASLKKGEPAVTSQQKVDFKTIKKGDNLNISVKLLPDGQLESQSVIILPPLNLNQKR